MNEERIILGIDPGTQVMGFGVVRIVKDKIELLACDVLNMKRSSDHYLKLNEIFHHTARLIQTWHPDDFAIEAPFFGKNVQSMLKLGRAQGVAIAAAINYQVPVFEYSPKKIKQSITGNGNSSKEQVAGMLRHIVSGRFDDKVLLDATDGLAAAVCHYFQRGAGKETTKYSGWDAFLNANPEKRLK